jgi:hypothetical protein
MSLKGHEPKSPGLRVQHSNFLSLAYWDYKMFYTFSTQYPRNYVEIQDSKV